MTKKIPFISPFLSTMVIPNRLATAPACLNHFGSLAECLFCDGLSVSEKDGLGGVEVVATAGAGTGAAGWGGGTCRRCALRLHQQGLKHLKNRHPCSSDQHAAQDADRQDPTVTTRLPEKTSVYDPSRVFFIKPFLHAAPVNEECVASMCFLNSETGCVFPAGLSRFGGQNNAYSPIGMTAFKSGCCAGPRRKQTRTPASVFGSEKPPSPFARNRIRS